jgi:phosphohistidine phosphatase
MELLLIRHGLAGDPNPTVWPDDGKRPLTPRGKRRMRQEGDALRRLRLRPDWVFTSPLLRAVQTAALVGRRLRVPPGRFQRTDHLLPSGEFAPLLQSAYRARPDGLIALVGHQPHLGRLLCWLLTHGASSESWELKKGAVAHLRLTWDPPPTGASADGTGFVPPRAELLSLLPPRVLRRI